MSSGGSRLKVLLLLISIRINQGASGHHDNRSYALAQDEEVLSSAHGRPTGSTVTTEDLITEPSFLDTLIAVLNATASKTNQNHSSTHLPATDKGGLFDSALDQEGQPRNLASWLRDSIIGRKWRRRQDQVPQKATSFLLPANPFLPPGHTGRPVAPPPHPGFSGSPFMPNFLPAPEGFPSPYGSDSVMLPPEALENTGIDYWLNFIEQTAANADRTGGNAGGGVATSAPPVQRPVYLQKPIGIGEKPVKRPTSIRDEMLLQDSNEEEDGTADTGPGGQRQPSMSQINQVKPDESSLQGMSPRCDKFTEHICVDDFEYPEQAIVDEVYKRREIFQLLYSDDGSRESGAASMVDGIPREVEEGYSYDGAGHQMSASTLSSGKAGYVCPSEVLYGKPKLARNRNGDWKVIVNAGEFTQTLRMEKCLKPNGRCNYIVPQLETRCAQVHSIHRLMVFEKGKGFFIDTFKIPTGCNCQIVRRKIKPNGQLQIGFQNSNQQPSSAGSDHFDDILSMQLPPPVRHPQHRPARPSGIRAPRPPPTLANSHKPGQAQLTNTLWSILMGGDPATAGLDDNLAAQLGLIQHLKQTYPHLSPEALLQQLGSDHGLPTISNRKQQPLQKLVFPNGQTTTIVNPAGSSNGNIGAPVVQVIHVPVTSNGSPGSSMPQPVYRPNAPESPQFIGMQAYETKQAGAATAESPPTDPAKPLQPVYAMADQIAHSSGNNISHDLIAERPEDEYEDEEGTDNLPEVPYKPVDAMGTDRVPSSSAPERDIEDQEEAEDQLDDTEQHHHHRQPAMPSVVTPPTITKRMLDKKINFNYHPILEYIAPPANS